MAFWSSWGKKKDDADGAQEEEVRGGAAGPSKSEAKIDAAAEKQRLKKIKAMKKKFDETVWSNAVDTMKSEIPAFTLTEPDPDLPGSEITRYVLLGFDTKIVDDFSNKSDDDVGSIMTAIKSGMDCVIEDPLFDNELILMIPTARTLAALAEFEDTFDLRFFVIYATEDHVISMETKTPDKEDDFVFVSLKDIRNMLENNIFVKDMIRRLQSASSSGDFGISGEPSSGENDGSGGDDIMSEDDYESGYGPMDEEDGPPDEGDGPPDDEDYGPPDEGGDAGGSGSRADDIKQAAAAAVSEAEGAGSKLSDQKDDVESAVQPQPAAQQPAQQPAQQNPGSGARPSSVRDRMNRLRGAVQTASDTARQDPEIAKTSEAIRPQPAQPQRFDEAALDQYIDRKYYSDDLGLEISSQPFDAMFVQGDRFEEFAVEPTSDWLGGYVNNVRMDANTRLRKLHQENMMLMRKQYLMIIAKLCEGIVKSVATDDPKSRFGYIYKGIHEDREARISKLPEQAEAYKRECEEAYQSRMRADMENAANTARASFINRYGKEHERELREIETDLKNNIESEFVAALDHLNTERRKEAKRQFDIGVTDALKACNDEYIKIIAQEKKEYARLQDVITKFINENMASDEARIHVLSEDQRRTNEVAQVRAEYDARISLANSDFEARLAAVRSEIDQKDVEHEKEVARVQDQYEHAMQQLRKSHSETLQHKDSEIGLLTDQLSKANANFDDLTQKYARLEQDVEKKYMAQIDMLRSERDAWNERADHVERLHKYTDKIKLTGVAVACVAAIGIGIITGCVIMSFRQQNAAAQNTTVAAPVQQDPVLHYYIDGKEVTPDEAAGTAGAGDAADDAGEGGGGNGQ